MLFSNKIGTRHMYTHKNHGKIDRLVLMGPVESMDLSRQTTFVGSSGWIGIEQSCVLKTGVHVVGTARWGGTIIFVSSPLF